MLSVSPLRRILHINLLALTFQFALMSQWSAHFTDSLTLSPVAWRGTLDKFRCDPIRGLLLYDTNPKSIANYACVKGGVLLSEQLTWHGKIRVDYTPTRDNSARLLLYCYRAEDDGSFDYVALTLDNQSYLRLSEVNVRESSMGKLSIRNINKILEYDYFDEMRTEGGSVDFVIQYDPTAEHHWNMWVRHDDRDPYKFVGNAGDTPPASRSRYSSFSILFGCKYSKTRAHHTSIEFLDIYPSLVSLDQFVDNSKVILAQDFYEEFKQIDNQTLEVRCSHEPDLSTATVSVSPSWGHLTTYTMGNTIRIRSDKPILEGVYALSLRGVQTSSGAQVGDALYEIKIGYDQPLPPPSKKNVGLIFSEFMVNPLSGGAEYIELHNFSQQAINAQSYSVGIWRQGGISSWHRLSDKLCLIPPGQYHAFTISKEAVLASNSAPRDSLTESSSLPQLVNKGFTIELLSRADSIVVESFHYTPHLLGKQQNQCGVALERYISPTGDRTKDFWGPALAQVHYATPGQRNSILAYGDPTLPFPVRRLCITEIMARPTVDGSEYIELFNPTDSIIDTRHFGLVIVQSGHPSKSYPLPAHPAGGIPPRGYVALTPSTHPLERLYGSHPDSLLLYPKMPQLPDNGCAIRLVSLATSDIIEEVYYDINTFPKSLQKVRGVAQERIIPDQNPQDLRNWTAAQEWANYGTPGLQNSVYGLSVSPDEKQNLPRQRIRMPLRHLARIVLQELSNRQTKCSATLYTIAGCPLASYNHSETVRLCQTIVQHQSLATILPPTVSIKSILVIELHHPDQRGAQHLVSIITN